MVSVYNLLIYMHVYMFLYTSYRMILSLEWRTFMNFKKIDIQDRQVINKYLLAADRSSCEFCFADIYMWRDKYNTEYCIEEEWLFIRQYSEDNNELSNRVLDDESNKQREFYYYVPITLNNTLNIKNAINKILIDAIDNNYSLSFGNINEKMLHIFKEDYSDIFQVENIRDYSDYIYNSSDLINLSGKKFHKKKNLINKFKRDYEGRWQYKSMTNADFDDVLKFNRIWCDNNLSKDIEDMYDETIAIRSALKQFEKLNMKGGILLVDGDIIAYTLGCESNKDVFVVQIEKALSSYTGAYQMINQLFASSEASNYKYINREEDLGIEGIRKAKMSYNPVFMEEYYVATADLTKRRIIKLPISKIVINE